MQLSKCDNGSLHLIKLKNLFKYYSIVYISGPNCAYFNTSSTHAAVDRGIGTFNININICSKELK